MQKNYERGSDIKWEGYHPDFAGPNYIWQSVSTNAGNNDRGMNAFDKAGYSIGSFGTAVGGLEHSLNYSTTLYSASTGLSAEVRALGRVGTLTLRYSSILGKALGGAGIAITIGDAMSNGLKNHHIADIAIGIVTTFVITSPIGFGVGTLYFVGDIAIKSYTGKSITEHIFD